MNFKEFYKHIYFDIDKSIHLPYSAKQGDTKSRGFYVTLLVNGVVMPVTDQSLSFYAEKPDKTRVIVQAVKDDDIFRVDLPNQIFAVPGLLKCELTLRGSDGEQISSKTFKMVVDSSIQDGSIVSKDERGILDRAFELAEDIIPRLELLNVELLEDIQNRIGPLEDQVSDIQDDLQQHKQDYLSHKNDYETYKVEVESILSRFDPYTLDLDVYGVEVDFENKIFTRLAGAVGKNPGADFDSILAFGGRRRCNLADNGTVNAYYDDPEYIEDGSNGQVMVEQLKFYYKVVPLKLEKIQNGIGYHLRKARYYISDTYKPGFKVHPAFIRNGVVKDKIYLSAYEGSIYDVSAGTYLLNDEQFADFGNDKLSSIAGAKPASGLTQNLTRANARKLANNRGTGWQISDVLSAAVTQLLFIIEYASFNMQSNIGLGVVNKTDDEGNESEITGATTNLGNTSGMADGTNGLVSLTYRGEENFWGNIWKWIDGLNIECKGIHQAYWADHDFQDNIKTSPYKNCGFTLAKSNGYISTFGYSEDCDFLFLPSETVGASNLPVGDYFHQNHDYTGFVVAPLGGYWAHGSNAGAFCWSVNVTSSYRYRDVGGRLLYVPPTN